MIINVGQGEVKAVRTGQHHRSLAYGHFPTRVGRACTPLRPLPRAGAHAGARRGKMIAPLNFAKPADPWINLLSPTLARHLPKGVPPTAAAPAAVRGQPVTARTAPRWGSR